MIFCNRQTCAAGTVTQFDMPLGCLKWKVKNFTEGSIYVSLTTYDAENTLRIASGESELAVDRNPKTGSRRTSRRLFVRAECAGEVEVDGV